jgi:hypothetical protein
MRSPVGDSIKRRMLTILFFLLLDFGVADLGLTTSVDGFLRGVLKHS